MSRYGRLHRQVREALLPAAIGTPCMYCRKVMRLGDRLDLDHTADGSGYRGIVHASCNRREGGRRGNRRARRPKRSREW